jgi:predicted amidohydrolase
LLGEERQVYRNGFRFATVDAEWGRFGLSIGHDLAFPETARSLTLDGAEIVVVSGNWEKNRQDAWRAHLISRACENSIFLAAANRVGEEPTMRFGGDSLMVGPSGEVYTVLDEDIEGYAVATIDLDEVRKVREDRQLIQYREPLAYRNIVKKY